MSETGDAVPWRMDPERLLFTYVGPQAARLLGIAAEAWLDPGFLEDRLSPDSRSAVLEQFRLVVEFGAGHEVEFRLRRDDNSWLWLRSTIQVIPTAAGPALAGLFFDISVRRALEADIRQVQKLEAVGRLSAGVAHEINTPVQFISDSLSFVNDGLGELWGLVRNYQAFAAGHPGEAAERIAALEQDIDLEYLTQNIPKALERCVDGLGRVTTLVRSLKEFSHPHNKERSAVDLNRAVESTLVIATSEYKYVADIETTFGPLPPVSCYPSELNQVFLNIVVNAAHAIAEVVQGTTERGTIQITTQHVGHDVVITIADTGAGIPEHVRDRIFDPFFTTKDVGKGTGQGLAIARRVVVEEHGGSLSFETEMGTGTTFMIRIPVVPAS